jgi:hypothetical protein
METGQDGDEVVADGLPDGFQPQLLRSAVPGIESCAHPEQERFGLFAVAMHRGDGQPLL